MPGSIGPPAGRRRCQSKRRSALRQEPARDADGSELRTSTSGDDDQAPSGWHDRTMWSGAEIFRLAERTAVHLILASNRELDEPPLRSPACPGRGAVKAKRLARPLNRKI